MRYFLRQDSFLPQKKLKLIRIMADDLETAEDISPLSPSKTYDLPTQEMIEYVEIGVTNTILITENVLTDFF